MKNTNNMKFYNIIFPVWLLFMFPLTWFIVIPANFLIDSTVVFIVLYLMKTEEKKEFYKRTILPVFLFGFLSDIIGGLLLLLTQFFGDSGWSYEYLTKPIAHNPFDNIYSLIYTILAIMVSGILIYIFNRFVSFRKCTNKRLKKTLSLVLALLTAPYLFLMPTTSFYGGSSDMFTNHIVWDDYIKAELYIDDSADDALNAGEHFRYETVSVFREAINTAEKVENEDTGDIKYTIVFYKTGRQNKYMDKIEITEINQNLCFEWKDRLYRIRQDNAQQIYESVSELLSGSLSDIESELS